MLAGMRVLRSITDLQDWRDALGGAPCVLVPTMGGLHAGHADLVRRGAQHAGGGACIASVFVNPKQFDDPADYERYPRELGTDVDLCGRHGARAVFAPDADAMFPTDAPLDPVPLPTTAMDRGLEDRFRPGHFEGVCLVVRRLFDLVRPTAAVFGEKDWQQLRVVSEIADRDNLGVEIVPGPTVREDDGLAMSSRNRFLPTALRRRAAAMPAALRAAARHTEPMPAERAMRDTLGDAGLTIDYAEIRDADTLGPWRPGAPGRAIIAARLGDVRLLDNGPWPAGGLASDAAEA